MKAASLHDMHVSALHHLCVFVLALLIALLPFLTRASDALDPHTVAWLKVGCAIIGALLAVMPSLYAFRINTGRLWSCVISDINATMGDVLAIRKEYKVTQAQVQQIQNDIGEAVNALKALCRAMQDDQQRMRDEIAQVKKLTDDIDDLRKQVSALTAHQEGWALHCLSYMEALDRLVDSSELSEQYRQCLAKSLADFGRAFEAQCIHIVAPSPADAFDARIHQEVAREATAKVAAGHVLRVKERGMMAGQSVLKKARVVIAEHAIPNDQSEIAETEPSPKGSYT